MGVRQRIENGLPLPAAGDQPGLLEDAQLVGDGRLGHFQLLCDVPHALLLMEQDEDDADTGGICIDLLQICDFDQCFL